ncbi:hypothetical protein EASAB2608_08295 [Streptomyces sp. EAS-AB2608]|nr:hypothetical protein EASAB2608_08295 [Streptomyces sp. EAS-AB2608]
MGQYGRMPPTEERSPPIASMAALPVPGALLCTGGRLEPERPVTASAGFTAGAILTAAGSQTAHAAGDPAPGPIEQTVHASADSTAQPADTVTCTFRAEKPNYSRISHARLPLSAVECC